MLVYALTNQRGEQVSHESETEGRHDMPTAQATESGTDIVQISTRASRALRQRMKIAAAHADVSVQQAQIDAFEEYLNKRGL
ncbi:hypothetical protein [Nocardiopsis sp. NPDC006938]|uniref:hypothetical protein n=1 Tax=Nocardiopsis sp. NPDC006938 TaxID=3364337 RepID=UPI0036A0B35A